MSFLRRIADQSNAGSDGTISLNEGGWQQPRLLVDEVICHLSITGTGTGAAWIPTTFLRASNIQSFYRRGDQPAALQHVKSVPLTFLGQLATTMYDGSLDAVDNELIAAGYATNVGATTIDMFVRVPVSLITSLKTGDDMAIRGDEIGQWLLTYGGNASASLAITSVRARLYARCRATRSARRCGIQSLIEFQSSKAPSPTDSLQLNGNKLVNLFLISTNGTSLAGVTNPLVDIDGMQLVDGQNMDSVLSIVRNRGETFYPQTVPQASYASSTWCPLVVPYPYQKTSELIAGQTVNLQFTANGLTAGQAFYLVHSLYPQTPADLIQRGLSPETARGAVDNAGKEVPDSVKQWLPYE